MASKTSFTIGRDASADIPVADESVSRIHAEVQLLDSGQVFVTDCNSSNGTFLVRGGTETRITQEKLGPGDKVRFGAVSLSAADLTAAIRRKLDSGPVPPPAAAKAKRFATGTNLVRCVCGDIKSKGQPCPSCGQ